MQSTNFAPEAADGSPEWRRAGLHYNHYNHFLRRRFGARIQKVSVDAGFTCPNVDGTVAIGGCTFCDNRSFSPSRRLPRQSITSQIDEGIVRLQRRYDCDRFLAYFQPATNTYAPIPRLESVYQQALSHPKIIGLAIGTRPDCLADEVLELIAGIAKKTYVSVELGLQTIHNWSLDLMNRGHHHQASVDALHRSANRGFEICAHLMLGLPGETHEDMMATAREVARLPIDSVKIHNLYVVKDTPLATQLANGEFSLMNCSEYVRTLVDFLEHLPPSMVVERISGDAPPDYFVGPAWCLDKPGVRLAVEHEFVQRKTCQGRLAGRQDS